ncbi:hypothetical protein BH20GEM1_BH20GEM1_10170 [soil metagenome]
MPKPNRLDVARKTGEIAPATKEGVAEALGVDDASAAQFEKAFGNAAERGLIEQQAPETGGTPRWTLSKKGERKLTSSADAD